MVIRGWLIVVIMLWFAPWAQHDAFAQSASDVKQMIIKNCAEQEETEPLRAACRQNELAKLKEYVSLLNRFPKNSRQYQALVGCSKEWPDGILMWKICASQVLPEEQAFKPFTLVQPGESYYEFRIDPKAAATDGKGYIPPMPFVPDDIPARPRNNLDDNGTYIPGGVSP